MRCTRKKNLYSFKEYYKILSKKSERTPCILYYIGVDSVMPREDIKPLIKTNMSVYIVSYLFYKMQIIV